jgi:hypothetical protein
MMKATKEHGYQQPPTTTPQEQHQQHHPNINNTPTWLHHH